MAAGMQVYTFYLNVLGGGGGWSCTVTQLNNTLYKLPVVCKVCAYLNGYEKYAVVCTVF